MFEVCILLHTTEMDATEQQLRYSLVAFVGGSRLVASPVQVTLRHFDMTADEVRAHHYRNGTFLICFRDDATVDRVLHAPRPPSVELALIFNRFTDQAGALFLLLRFKVLISIEILHVPA
jgi:hypothetical protein